MKHEQIDQLYRSVDCLVCPSQNHEAFGLVNVEAMASGIPVIASDNGGFVKSFNRERTDFDIRLRKAAAFRIRFISAGKQPCSCTIAWGMRT